MKPKNNQTTAPADTWNFEEKIKEWEAKHTTRAVIDGCERYWYFAFQELWGIYAEFIRRLKEEIKRDNISLVSREIVFSIINSLAGKELSGEKE